MGQPSSDYRAKVLLNLDFIPDEDLKAIYKIIDLIAKPHRAKADTKPN